eukprot:CAMPEP_0198348824 /NCGR_PEP_ID=MMETSP1450-20131203/91462_1 /TAXON_ID=753684 ORGANISM="Madagascaria erythrocladiodes, Strain CCMP3234" /NCGR_SAMPLE_ID=MMETSP1450 /ASSEMBLY_ACC=CAM_ASM_001115 /LENGTH=47 /DNA_ID= /DNA_START= /DNA_END= /DNA_ORIENTATION=
MSSSVTDVSAMLVLNTTLTRPLGACENTRRCSSGVSDECSGSGHTRG